MDKSTRCPARKDGAQEGRDDGSGGGLSLSLTLVAEYSCVFGATCNWLTDALPSSNAKLRKGTRWTTGLKKCRRRRPKSKRF